MTLSVLCLAIVLSSFLGGLIPLATRLTHTRLQVYLSFSAGAMLGAAFLHMMPESVDHGSSAMMSWCALGLLALFFLERFFSYHHHESAEIPKHDHGHDHDHNHAHDDDHRHEHAVGSESNLSWGAVVIGMSIHSLVGGVALASAWLIDQGADVGLLPADAGADGHLTHEGEFFGGPAFFGVFLATVIHKPADALTIVSLMMRAGITTWRAHVVNLAFAVMVPLGVLLFWLFAHRLVPDMASQITARALAFSAGTFLCIALSDLLPELQFHNHDRVKLSLALLVGFGLMAVTELWSHGGH